MKREEQGARLLNGQGSFPALEKTSGREASVAGLSKGFCAAVEVKSPETLKSY
jgi:hypothetical protein